MNFKNKKLNLSFLILTGLSFACGGAGSDSSSQSIVCVEDNCDEDVIVNAPDTQSQSSIPANASLRVPVSRFSDYDIDQIYLKVFKNETSSDQPISASEKLDSAREFLEHNITSLKENDRISVVYQYRDQIIAADEFVMRKDIISSDNSISTRLGNYLSEKEVQAIKLEENQNIDLPDIVIESLSLPTEVCVGESLLTELVISNSGSANVNGLFHVGWYLSQDNQWDENDRLLLGGRDQVDDLEIDEEKEVAIHTNQIPYDVEPGDYYIIVRPDDLDLVTEINEDDQGESEIEITDCKNDEDSNEGRLNLGIDLAIHNLIAPGVVRRGQDIGDIIHLDVVNQGNEDLEEFVHITYYISEDKVLDRFSDTLLIGGADQLQTIASGDIEFVDAHNNIIPDVNPGNYYLIVAIDESNEVPEISENNNILILPIEII